MSETLIGVSGSMREEPNRQEQRAFVAPPEAVEHVPGSNAHMERARKVIPRGMASRGRVRAVPIAFRSAQGSHLVDLDGNRYVDCVMALGPLLLGHSPSRVLDRVREQLEDAIQFGGQHIGEVELAETLVRVVPCAEKVVFSNTGSEAIQAALRIARATTGRRLIIKFDGHYHGWIDPVFVNSPGVPAGPDNLDLLPVRHNTAGQPAPSEILVCPWNDLGALASVLNKHGEDVAGVIMEPVPFNLGTFWPDPGYLEGVRALCDAHGALLIFDEVVSGFRLALGGAQEVLGVVPDLATYAKGVASGFPLALVCGSDRAMQSAIDGPVVHGGTYNGTPMCVAAAQATVDYLEDNRDTIYRRLDELGTRLSDGFRTVARTHQVPLQVNQIGSVVQMLWTPRMPTRSYADAAAADASIVADLCERMLADGVHVAPRGLLFLSAAHEPEDIDQVISALDCALTRRAAAHEQEEHS